MAEPEEPPGFCGPVAGIVLTQIRDDVAPEHVESFVERSELQHSIGWFQVVVDVRVVGRNFQEIKSALSDASLVVERPLIVESGGVYAVTFRARIEEAAAVEWLESIPGLEIVAARRWPTIVRFVVEEGTEDAWITRLDRDPIVEVASRQIVCSQ